MKRLALAIGVAAAPPTAGFALTLEQALEAGAARAPQVKAQADLTTAARRDRWRRWLLNEPQATFASADDGASESYGLALTLPFPAKAFASSALDSARARAQEIEREARRFEAAKAAVEAYVGCALAREALQLQKTAADDLDQLARSISALYQSGHSALAEKIGAELQARQANVDAATAEDKAGVACRKLADALFQAELPETESVPDDLAAATVASLSAALGERSPDEARARAAQEVAHRSESAASWQQAPDFTFAAARNHYLTPVASPSGREWTTTFTVSVSLPILFPFHEANEWRRASAQARLDASLAEVQERAASVDVSEAAREYRRSRQRLKEIRSKDLALAQALFDGSMAAYRLGKIGFSELLFSRKTLADLRTQDLQLRASAVLARMRCLSRCESEAPPVPR